MSNSGNKFLERIRIVCLLVSEISDAMDMDVEHAMESSGFSQPKKWNSASTPRNALCEMSDCDDELQKNR